MKNDTSIAVIPSKVGEPIIEFDEQVFINETLDILTELHGSYNRNDERLVKQMASVQRSFEIADRMLFFPNQHIQQTGSNGTQPSTWFRVREAAIAQVLKIRKDLGIDLMSRKPLSKVSDSKDMYFSHTIKDKAHVFKQFD